ncbi:hypothetical protein CLU99_4368 [Flavobacterium sp. 2]|nr:hypothetical protein CLU99_4368 [Flavobacterium sp. 2]
MFSNFYFESSLILYSQIKTPFYKEKETASLLLHTLTQESILKKNKEFRSKTYEEFEFCTVVSQAKQDTLKLNLVFFFIKTTTLIFY